MDAVVSFARKKLAAGFLWRDMDQTPIDGMPVVLRFWRPFGGSQKFAESILFLAKREGGRWIEIAHQSGGELTPPEGSKFTGWLPWEGDIPSLG